jgi:hypothetical protein
MGEVGSCIRLVLVSACGTAGRCLSQTLIRGKALSCERRFGAPSCVSAARSLLPVMPLVSLPTANLPESARISDPTYDVLPALRSRLVASRSSTDDCACARDAGSAAIVSASLSALPSACCRRLGRLSPARSGPKPGIAFGSLKSHWFSAIPMKSRIAGSLAHARRSARRVSLEGTRSSRNARISVSAAIVSIDGRLPDQRPLQSTRDPWAGQGPIPASAGVACRFRGATTGAVRAFSILPRDPKLTIGDCGAARGQA